MDNGFYWVKNKESEIKSIARRDEGLWWSPDLEFDLAGNDEEMQEMFEIGPKIEEWKE